jgi:hypothetical protein
MLQRRHLRSVLALLLACSGMHVSSAREYYENAEECFDWARTAKTERERLIFLQMAESGSMSPDDGRPMKRVLNQLLVGQSDESA